jgi:ribosomal protein L4
MDNLKDILSNLSTDIDQETLLLYLQDKLSAEKKHEVEKKLLENEFANDAAEGLQEFKNKENLSLLVNQLNRDLKKKLRSRKLRTGKIHLAEQPWIYFAVILVIILIIISFFVIQRLLKH